MSLKVHRNSTQRRNDSGELDVFEATKYFSTYNEVSAYNGGYLSQKAMREERQALGGRRMSLDVHTTASLPSQSQRVDKQMKEKKQKLPSSPGGRLASFLNSLFNQASSKKKKSKANTTQSMKDEEESPGGGRRKRRSSMSLFQSINPHDSKSIFASSTASGFRTPPPYVDTPTKIHKDIRSYSDHKHVVSLPKYTGSVRSVTSQDETLGGKKNIDLAWLDEKFNFIDGYSEKNKDRIWISSEKKNGKRCSEIDDGGESDSSSDLFELENYDLGSYSSDLPVYETTHMESIKRGPPISTGPL